MSFGWINLVNTISVTCLIVINILAAKKNIAGSFSSKYRLINIFEQVGRYGCMVFMILPLAVQNFEFGFSSSIKMIVWLCLTIVLLLAYAILWIIKTKSGRVVLFGLAIIPVCLFLINGILLQHILLILFAFIFGIFHIIIVYENA